MEKSKDVCGWKEINRSREGNKGERQRTESVKLEENGQKKNPDKRRKLMRGHSRRMGWRAKVGDRLTQFQGKMWQDEMSHKKGQKQGEMSLSKLGNCPPWYLSCSNLISHNKLHYCAVALFLSLKNYSFTESFSITTFIIHSTDETSLLRQICTTVYCVFTAIRPGVRGSEADAAPWETCPTPFPLHFHLPSLFPLIPPAHCRENIRTRSFQYKTVDRQLWLQQQNHCVSFLITAPSSAFISSCSDSLLWPKVVTAPAFIIGAFKPGQRNPARPVRLSNRTN